MLSNPAITLDIHSPILFPYGCEQGDPFTTANLEGQYPLLCAAGDGQIFCMMCLFVIHPVPATSKCHLLVLMAELSDKYLAAPASFCKIIQSFLVTGRWCNRWPWIHLDKAVDCVHILLNHLPSHPSFFREVLLFALLMVGLFFNFP